MVVCWILSQVRLLADRKRTVCVAGKPSKILFVKFAEQGSTVLAYHAITRAIEMVGRENVYFLVFQENRFILDVMNLIPKQNVITIRHKNLIDAGMHALLALHRIRRLRIDASIDCHSAVHVRRRPMAPSRMLPKAPTAAASVGLKMPA